MKTHITFILDRSGSMQTCRDEAISGHNEYVKSQRDTKTEYMLITFDSMEIKNFGVQPINDAVQLTRDTYIPGAATPLFDAIGQGIVATEKAIKGKKRRVLFVILTDGLENASKEYRTLPDVKKLIDNKKNWTFVYLAQGIDGFDAGLAMGINPNNTVQVNTQNMRVVMGAMSIATTSFDNSKGLTGTNFFQDVDVSTLAESKK